MQLRVIVTVGLAVASLAVVSSASADEVTVGSYTMPVTTIVGRVPRPSVVIELSRAKAEVKLADLHSPTVEKILRAGSKDPF